MTLLCIGHVTGVIVPSEMTDAILNYIDKYVHDTIVVEDGDGRVYIPTAYVYEFINDLKEESQNFIWQIDKLSARTSKHVSPNCVVNCCSNGLYFILCIEYGDSRYRILDIDLRSRKFIFFMQDSICTDQARVATQAPRSYSSAA